MTDKTTTTAKRRIPLQATERGVQKTYTDAAVLADLRRKKAAGMSLRQIASEYDGITHADIQRALQGHLPHDPHKRIALHLAPMLPAPACPRCGSVHVTKRCTAAPRAYTRIVDVPTTVLRWMIDNRQEM